MGGIAGGFLLIMTAVMLMLYRNWKYEQELDSLLWKVNYKDIQIKEKKDESTGVNEAPTKCNSKVNAWLRSLYPTPACLSHFVPYNNSLLFPPFPSTQLIPGLSKLTALFRYQIPNDTLALLIQRL